jgi:hypothetical protein
MQQFLELFASDQFHNNIVRIRILNLVL